MQQLIREGLYDPINEHDACGVGFIADLNNKPTHDIVRKAIQIVQNLEHRGACGCDPETGDGAGMLVQIPDEFFHGAAEACGFDLPKKGSYGIGMVFLPSQIDERIHCMNTFNRVIEEEGQILLGWRDVPTNPDALGWLARSNEPVIKQVFIGRADHIETEEDFERTLYIIRKRVNNAVYLSCVKQKKHFYIPTLSCRTICYKGLLLANQVSRYFLDLNDENFTSAMALVHQRYSTNTFPTWDLAHPFRFLAHNGEINTLRGNYNWFHARAALFKSEKFPNIQKIRPITYPGQSDSATLDNALELIYHTGRSLAHTVCMLVPEAWENHTAMSDERRAFYEYHSCLMEAWDGPASLAVTDGRQIGALLDRNGLRPSRYWVTKQGLVVMASEAGVVDIPQEDVKLKGRLQPGRIFMCDLEEHRIINDEEIKESLITRQPYGEWLKKSLVQIGDLPQPENARELKLEELALRQRAFGYTMEDLRILMTPMARDGKEPIGSMGNDAPLAVLSERPQPLFSYFKQLFAQVTNPPLDAIREELVTSLFTKLGAEGNLFDETEEQCHMLSLKQPILTNRDMARIKEIATGELRATTIPIFFDREKGPKNLEKAMEVLCEQVDEAIELGHSIIVLSDRGIEHNKVPIPSLLAVAGVHHHLVRNGMRTLVGLVLESGEPRETHHYSTLVGYGCGAINPYLAFDSIEQLRLDGEFGDLPSEAIEKNYIKAIGLGLLKTMSKMGISTVQSYRGAQIFEAVGLNAEVISHYFSGTPSRIQGIDIETIASETMRRHELGFPERKIAKSLGLPMGGQYHWRRDGERHMINPFTISRLQEASRENSKGAYEEFARMVNEDARTFCTLRGLMKFKNNARLPVPIEEVEPAKEIVKRFKTGAMSYGSISHEAHSSIAIAMNRLGGKSNTGEGGEDEARFEPDPKTGDSMCSKIKQVASGRFGVTINYLVHSEEIQIKMAQGAKPGEGGQLPGHKVNKIIGRVRHSTPGVGLISPPPHHDIYSIEDMAQLIHDLKCANSNARINVKLVSEVGVGTIAAGVAKGKADVILISGHDGGTGASPLSSVKHTGLPWELGISETHQVLLKNDLRSRVRLETDGQLKTGRDIAIACLLGAEEYGFSTAPLISMGCIMMRKCHLNTCPVGIATQDPDLRKKFNGKPQNLVNYFFFVAEEMRQIMAKLGFRSVDEMVGRTEVLDFSDLLSHWKTLGIDLSPIFHKPQVPEGWGSHCTQKQDHGLETKLDNKLIRLAEPALERQEKVEIEMPIHNIDRTVGTMLSSEVARRYGQGGLPEDTIAIKFRGSAGQSCLAFGARGITMDIEGDANDYFGKGLSGSKLIVRPDRKATFVPEDNIIVGNVSFYGAVEGEAYIRGMAGERFCVRNSGVEVVVEGIGDHGCEYMTGGRAVILGETGRNFAAGMSGGIAYILDRESVFPSRCNMELVDLESLEDAVEIAKVRDMIEKHVKYTGSGFAQDILDKWDELLPKFVKVMPRDFKRALAEMAREAEEENMQPA